MLHVKLTFEAEETSGFGIQLKSDGANVWTKYWYEDGQIYGETTDRGEAASPGAVSGELQLINGELAMDIYIDRSLVEGFFNESKALSIRSYSDYEAQQISVFGDDDIKVKDICIAKMGSI